MSRESCHNEDNKPATDSTVDLYCNCCNCMVRSKPRNKPGAKKEKKSNQEVYNELKKKY